MALSEQEEFELLSLQRARAMRNAPSRPSQADVRKSERPEPPPPTLLDKAGGLIDTAKRYGIGVPGGILTVKAAEGMDKVGELADRAGYAAGGAVTDQAGKVLPAEAAAGLGYATNVGVQAVPALLSGQGLKTVAAPVMHGTAKGLMHSALKPGSKDIVSGDAAKAIDTLLREGANISANGIAKLRGLVDKLHGEVAQKIEAAAKSGAAVPKNYVSSEVYQVLQKFRNQLNSSADEAAILKSWQETSAKLADRIPVDQAQSLKQGTYSVLSDKYAKMGAVENEAATQAQMAGARGLRKGIEDTVPGVGPLNARESEIINAIELAEKRAGIGGNKDIGGIAWLAHNPTAAAAMMADRSAAFKSWLANKIYQARNVAPRTAGTGVVAGYEAFKQNE